MFVRLKRFFKKGEVAFFLLLLSLAVLATLSVYYFKFNGPPIRSDGIGYYAYLPSVFIHGDISMNKFMQERAAWFKTDVPDTWAGITKQENGNYLDKYTMGEAAMMLPFFTMGHILTLIFHQETTGFTLFYQGAVGFGGTLYMILGLFLLKRFLENYFKPKVIYFSLAILLFATNLFHYGTYDSIFSHAYSFFLFSLFLFILPKWNAELDNIKGGTLKDYRYSLLLGITTGLITLVRPTNILFPIILVLFFNLDLRHIFTSLFERVKIFLKEWKSLALIVISSFIVFSPQIIYWKLITGKFFVFSYQGEYFDFLHPEIAKVLFSTERGVLFWCPVLIFAFIGIFLLRKKLSQWILPIFLFTIINLYIISSWWAWGYGGAFGHRGFVESFALISIPLTAFYSKVFKMRSKVIKYLLIILSISLALLSSFLMVRYWQGIIPVGATTTWEVFLNAFKL